MLSEYIIIFYKITFFTILLRLILNSKVKILDRCEKNRESIIVSLVKVMAQKL